MFVYQVFNSVLALKTDCFVLRTKGVLVGFYFWVELIFNLKNFQFFKLKINSTQLVLFLVHLYYNSPLKILFIIAAFGD
jgi:hypothetical protein